MSDFKAIADRVEIEALRGQFYQRSADGWKFIERVYEVRQPGAPANRRSQR